jgi:hypothetical protein
MKVAQQFIAGLAFILRIVPLGTIDNRFLPCVASEVNAQTFPSSLSGTDAPKKVNPPLK